jgi:hypothetical protein
MRRAVLVPAVGVLLAGPTVLAFFSGGYFDGPRVWAAFVAWGLVLAVALAAPRPLPVSGAGRTAVAGLVLLGGWTAASLSWAPLADPATDAVLRVVLYAGALLAAIALLRDGRAARALEPGLAAGAVVVVGYGLSGRVLPGLIELDRSAGAGGRLEQPITYWNAEGALAAMGLVLCARLAGDRTRPLAVRMLAAAGCAPLGAGVYLSLSRAAIAAAVVGLVVLVAAAPTWPQLRAAAGALAGGLAAAAASAAFPGFASLEGDLAARTAEGAAMGGILLLLAAAAALATLAAVRREEGGLLSTADLPRPVRPAVVAGVAVALTAAGLVVTTLGERGDAAELNERRAGERLTTVSSRRYDYWRVGWDAFASEPARGVGAGGFRVVWLRERPVRDNTLEAHSLELETAVELGIVGLVLLGVFLGGVVAASRRALRTRPVAAAGPVAAGTVWMLHSAVDWDWQVPAVTLPAILLAGALVAAAEADADAGPAARARAARTPAAKPEPEPAGV